MTASACYLCGEPTASGVYVHNATRTRAPFLTIACARCGLIQHAEHPSAEELSRYYSSGDYRREFPPLPIAGIAPNSRGYPALRRAWASQLVDAVEASVGPLRGRVVYEVGAGDCAAAGEMARRGATVTAVEIDPTIIPDGVTVAPELPATLEPGVVVSFQVIEHQADPLATIASWLRAGTVYMECPNAWWPYYSLTHFLQYPHVTTWCPRTLVLACIMAGAGEVAYAENGTILAVRAKGGGERKTYDEAAALFTSPYDGERAARELRGAFGL